MNKIVQFNIIHDSIFRFKLISSANVGIVSGYLITTNTNLNLPKFKMLNTIMPNYTNFIFNKEKKINFHIGGYSTNNSEALVKMCGETVERYSSIFAHLLLNNSQITFDSYKNLLKSGKSVINIKWIKLFSSHSLEKISKKSNEFSDKIFTECKKINWFNVYSVFEKRNVWIPCQLFFIAFPVDLYKEKRFVTSVSTGTAAHTNMELALRNALIEAIQINAFFKNWYYNLVNAKQLIIDEENLKKDVEAVIKGMDDIELYFHYYSDAETELIIVGCYVISKKRIYPAISFGIQAGFTKKEAIMGALFESLAVYYANCINYKKAFGEDFSHIKNSTDSQWFGDLDKNVYFYANPNFFQQNWNKINSKIKGEITSSKIIDLIFQDPKKANQYLLKKLKHNKRDLYIMNITAPEIKDFYQVVRVYIPQFIPVTLPSLPFDNHPISGKVKNSYIHPLA